MLYNNATQIKRDILFRTTKAILSDNMENLNRIPYDAAPRDKDNIRCCIHKDRAVLKYRTMAALGYKIEDEVDELKMLSQYGQEIDDTAKLGLTVIGDACSSCSLGGYFISDVCASCVAKPCNRVCPKNAISVVNDRSVIDKKLCVNCGKCETVCPYNAVVKVSVPCESTCPVGALEKNSAGVETIDKDKCISCGMCINGCPFGAITDISQLQVVISKLKSKTKKVNALIAPSIVGQFPGSLYQIESLLKDLGYSNVYHVGNSAGTVASLEADEFIERDNIMTSSCCPAFTMCVEKHADGMKQYLSHTPSPMLLAGKKIKDQDSDVINVFIGPCIAKKNEALQSEVIDYVITFEELGAHIMASGLELLDYPDKVVEVNKNGYGFARSGGVVQGVINELRDRGVWITPETINGIDKKTIKRFKHFEKLTKGSEFIEVMSCNGGCQCGPGVIVSNKVSGKALDSLIN